MNEENRGVISLFAGIALATTFIFLSDLIIADIKLGSGPTLMMSVSAVALMISMITILITNGIYLLIKCSSGCVHKSQTAQRAEADTKKTEG